MSKVHLIIDFQYNYYRNKYAWESQKRYGNASELTCKVNGETVVTTLLYRVMRDIEKYRKTYLKPGDAVTVSIAADSKNVTRREEDSTYKSNRVGKLTESDIDTIERILTELGNIGYNVYRVDGYEADDIIHELVENTKGLFDRVVIYTNDADILVNVKGNVTVERYKSSTTKYTSISEDNFSEIMSAEYKCRVPYNTILLYKSLVGDKSDKIAGVKGFGAKSFDKVISALENHFGSDIFLGMENPDKTAKALEVLNGGKFLTDSQYQEALHSLDLVKYKIFDKDHALTTVQNNDSDEKRRAVFEKYAMFSLLK